MILIKIQKMKKKKKGIKELREKISNIRKKNEEKKR